MAQRLAPPPMFGVTQRVSVAVADAIERAAQEPGNPASVHAFGQRARREVERCQGLVRHLVDAPDTVRVVITGSGLEAEWLAILGAARALRKNSDRAVSVAKLCDKSHLDDIWDALLDEDFSVQERAEGADFVVGDIPILGSLPFHCSTIGDEAHALFEGAVTLALDARDIGGPPGIGAVLVADGWQIEPLWHGGAQQGGLRSGSESVALCAGYSAAIQHRLNEHKTVAS